MKREPRYQIVKRGERYCSRIRVWWWPFWVDLDDVGYRRYEDAEKAILDHRGWWRVFNGPQTVVKEL